MEQFQENVTMDAPMDGFSEKILFEALANSSDYVYPFKIDINKQYTILSDRAVKYFGLPEGYETNIVESWGGKVHPDDRQGYQDDLMNCLNGKQKIHDYQYRIRNANGEYVWVHCVGSAMKNEDGKPFFAGLFSRLNVTGKYDDITNCLNIQQFHAKMIKKPISLLLFGFDGFRNVLNSLGFTGSNEILKMLGDILKEQFKVGNVFRMPGDEFLVLCESSSKEELMYEFDTAKQEFKKCFKETGIKVSVGFSCGACDYNPETETKDDAIIKLEQALAYSKQQGKELFTMYNSVIGEQHNRISKLKYALSNAIKEDFQGFSLMYQPIMTGTGKAVDGVEALLRFYDEELGNVSPMEFIPILEESNEIREVGQWVAKEAFHQKLKWDKVHPGFHVGINVSLKQLQSADFTDYLIDLVNELGIDFSEIIIELTESCKMEDEEHLTSVLLPLHDRGVRIVLDDFGMEQSSFALVQKLPITGVKVDHSFVRVMANQENMRNNVINEAIVSSIIYMCKQIDLHVVVEGVENEEVDQMIGNMDPTFLQGYYYSRPVSAEQIEEKWL